MTVRELEELLAMLPDDTVVLIKGVHVDHIWRRHPGEVRAPRREACPGGCNCLVTTWDETVESPGAIDLCHTIYAKGLYAAPPKVKLVGRWPRKAKALFA